MLLVKGRGFAGDLSSALYHVRSSSLRMALGYVRVATRILSHTQATC